MASLVEALAGIVGADNVLAQDEARQQYANDQFWYAIAATGAGQPISRPDVAVKPTTSEQVAQIVRLANIQRVPITPWGGGSGVQGAANADQGGIVLDLPRRNGRPSAARLRRAGQACCPPNTARSKTTY
jgi:FAD/FMN-containing dehydrogenase